MLHPEENDLGVMSKTRRRHIDHRHIHADGTDKWRTLTMCKGITLRESSW